MSSQARASQVTPNVVVDDVEKLRGFYIDKLGFGHMMGIVGKDIEVADVDAYHDQVRGRVQVKEPLKTQWWGDRNFGVDDPYGYRLWFYKTVQAFADVKIPAGVTVV